jgi:hypothetical protein
MQSMSVRGIRESNSEVKTIGDICGGSGATSGQEDGGRACEPVKTKNWRTFGKPKPTL